MHMFYTGQQHFHNFLSTFYLATLGLYVNAVFAVARCPSVSNLSNQFNSNLAAREPDSK